MSHAVVQSKLQKAKNDHLSLLITPADKLSLRISIGSRLMKLDCRLKMVQRVKAVKIRLCRITL